MLYEEFRLALRSLKSPPPNDQLTVIFEYGKILPLINRLACYELDQLALVQSSEKASLHTDFEGTSQRTEVLLILQEQLIAMSLSEKSQSSLLLKPAVDWSVHSAFYRLSSLIGKNILSLFSRSIY